MEELTQILKAHAARYPEMEPTDAVKLIYQNEFGGGHLIRDEAACLTYLRREYDSTHRSPALPLWEDIGNGIVRVNLAALTEQRYPLDKLGRDFIRSAREHSGTVPSFEAKLALLRTLTENGDFSFSLSELDAYLTGYRAAGFPPVSHSPRYRAAYTPAYRVIRKEYLPK